MAYSDSSQTVQKRILEKCEGTIKNVSSKILFCKSEYSILVQVRDELTRDRKEKKRLTMYDTIVR